MSSVRHHDATNCPRPSSGHARLADPSALSPEPLHGWGISERIQQISQDVLQINQGSLYPALHRLEHRAWIEADWGVSEQGRRAKDDQLTSAGRRQLAVEAERVGADVHGHRPRNEAGVTAPPSQSYGETR